MFTFSRRLVSRELHNARDLPWRSYATDKKDDKDSKITDFLSSLTQGSDTVPKKPQFGGRGRGAAASSSGSSAGSSIFSKKPAENTKSESDLFSSKNEAGGLLDVLNNWKTKEDKVKQNKQQQGKGKEQEKEGGKPKAVDPAQVTNILSTFFDTKKEQPQESEHEEDTQDDDEESDDEFVQEAETKQPERSASQKKPKPRSTEGRYLAKQFEDAVEEQNSGYAIRRNREGREEDLDKPMESFEEQHLQGEYKYLPATSKKFSNILPADLRRVQGESTDDEADQEIPHADDASFQNEFQSKKASSAQFRFSAVNNEVKARMTKVIRSYPKTEQERNFEYTDYDLPFSLRSLERSLNSPKGRVQLAQILGATEEPLVTFKIFKDPPPIERHHRDLWAPDLKNIRNARKVRDDLTRMLENSSDGRPTKQNIINARDTMMETRKSMIYSFHPADDMLIDNVERGLDELERIPVQERLGMASGQYAANIKVTHFDEDAEEDDKKCAAVMESITTSLQERGRRHGQVLREFTLPIEDLYDENKMEVDFALDKIVQQKIKNDPAFAALHRKDLAARDQLLEDIRQATKKYGRDQEETLRLENMLHRLQIKMAKRFDERDFETYHIPVRENVRLADLPILDIYQGPDGDRRFLTDFEHQRVVIPPLETYREHLPNYDVAYFDAIEETFTNEDERRRHYQTCTRKNTKNALHCVKLLSDTIDKMEWFEYELGLTLPMPRNGVEYASCLFLLSFHYYKQIEWKSHLHQLVTSRLSKDVKLVKEELQDFIDFSAKLDEVEAAKKKKKDKAKAFQIQADIKYPKPPKRENILRKAYFKYGYCTQEVILEQAHRILNDYGVKFTVDDIPAQRRDHFNHRFRAIYFNGNLLPEDKALAVAETIKNLIVSKDQLILARASIDIMARGVTPFDKQEILSEVESNASGTNTIIEVDNRTMDQSLPINFEEEKDLWKDYNSDDFEPQPVPYTESADAFEPLKKFRTHAEQEADWVYALELPIHVPKQSRDPFDRITEGGSPQDVGDDFAAFAAAEQDLDDETEEEEQDELDIVAARKQSTGKAKRDLVVKKPKK